MTDIDLADLRAKAVAATGGPWHWAGNTDTGEPYLATWIKGAGRCQVLSIGYDERSTTGAEADRMRDSMSDSGYDEADLDDMVRDWAMDSFGQPMRDPRVYEVAPNATSREDPDVYRADVVGIRHPDAEYIAAVSPDVVLALLDEIARLKRGR